MIKKTEITVDKVDNAVKNFASLPDDARIRIRTVEKLLACSRSSVWRLVRSGVLKTKKLTPKTTTFGVGDVRQLLARDQ